MLREVRSEFIGSFDDQGVARVTRDELAMTLRNMRKAGQYLVQMKPVRQRGQRCWYEVWLYEYERSAPVDAVVE